MTSSDSTPSAAAAAAAPLPLAAKKENIPITPKLAELNESRQELLNRIQNLKQDLQGWRSKMDTQVKVYRDELLELKQTLNIEVDQLRSEFQELRTTLQQQQEDVTASLKNLGLQDVPVGNKETDAAKIEVKDEKDQDLPKDKEENKEEAKS